MKFKIKFCLIFLIAFLSFSCGNISDKSYELDEKTFSPETYTYIQKESGFKLPVNAKGLNFYYWPPIDPGFAAKLKIPKESKNQIIEQIEKIKINNQSENTTFEPVGSSFKWWLNKNVKIINERSVFTSNSYFIVYLTEEGEDLILYIEYSVI